MTDQEVRVNVGPLVQVVLPGEEPQTFPFSDLAQEGDDAATISDARLIECVARWMDRPVTDFSRMQVRRPETGNIVLMEKPTYGVA